MIRNFKAIILLLFAGLSFGSCSLIGDQSNIVGVKDHLLTINDRPFFIKGVCYHPVEKGQTIRSFEQIEKDLKLIKAGKLLSLIKDLVKSGLRIYKQLELLIIQIQKR
jgi:hypothetical protein